MTAATVTFDDIDASLGDVPLSSYQGFTWTNFSAYTTVPGFPGFNNGIVSAANAAYSGGEMLGDPVLGQISAISAFDLTSASLGSGYYDSLNVTVQGFLAGKLEYAQTVTVGTSGAQLFNFGFAGIDSLTFSAAATASTTDPYNCGPVNCTQFTVDNIILTPDTNPPPPPPPPPPPINTPEPASLALVSLGALILFSMRGVRRHR